MVELIKLLDDVSVEIDSKYSGDTSVKVDVLISIAKAKQLLEGEIYGRYEFEVPIKLNKKI